MYLLASYKLFDDIVIVTFTGRVFVWLHIKCLIILIIVTFAGRVFVWLHINCLIIL